MASTLIRPGRPGIPQGIALIADGSDIVHGPSALIDALGQLGSDVEDWICETSFARGEQRHARRLEPDDLPGSP